MQTVAVQSIGIYTACTSAFVAIAPSVPHSDTGLQCDVSTYRRRMWCRAEILCHALRNGSHFMWLATTEDNCRPLEGDRSWLDESMHVFQGDATKETDKLLLVKPVFGRG